MGACVQVFVMLMPWCVGRNSTNRFNCFTFTMAWIWVRQTCPLAGCLLLPCSNWFTICATLPKTQWLLSSTLQGQKLQWIQASHTACCSSSPFYNNGMQWLTMRGQACFIFPFMQCRPQWTINMRCSTQWDTKGELLQLHTLNLHMKRPEIFFHDTHRSCPPLKPHLSN